MIKKDAVYVVAWPENGVGKVGYSSVRRWEAFISRGAEVVYTCEFDTSTDAFHIESLLHKMARERFPKAFDVCTDEARNLLGNNGAGFMECYQASADDLSGLVSNAIETAVDQDA